jgi:hypothetical protein
MCKPARQCAKSVRCGRTRPATSSPHTHAARRQGGFSCPALADAVQAPAEYRGLTASGTAGSARGVQQVMQEPTHLRMQSSMRTLASKALLMVL